MKIDAITPFIIGILSFYLAVYGNFNIEKIAKNFGSITRKRSLFGYSTTDSWNVLIFRVVFIFLTIFGILLTYVGIREFIS